MKEKAEKKKGKRIVLSLIAVLLAAVLITLLWSQFVYIDKGYTPVQTNEPFRVALSLSPFSLPQLEEGYTFRIGDKTASTPQELQKVYMELGATEMYCRIATKRHVTDEDTVDGVPDSNANVHTFDQGIELCRIAAKAKGLTEQPASNPFTDTDDKDVLALNKAGVISGMSATEFKPNGLLTRAQIAKIIWTLRKV